jgi:[methyl-Co(III) methanol-specific corrinoid protein]:coenzyme M methyltransferase
VLRATQTLHEKHADLPVIVGIEGICTLAGHLVGIENIMKWSIREREKVSKMLDLTTQANIAYAEALIDAGADVICVADPTASPELLSPRDFASLIKPRLKEVSDAIRKRGGLGVLHICGRAQRICKDMAETGFDGLSVEEKVDIAQARDHWQKTRAHRKRCRPRSLFSGTLTMSYRRRSVPLPQRRHPGAGLRAGQQDAARKYKGARRRGRQMRR